MSEERLSFQAEVSRLLDIVAHSLYSEKEVFLRELISNASDACDRLRYAALTEPGLSADDPNLAIALTVDKEARTLTVADNGIGMNRQDLVENLGTIARSGTAEFMHKLTGDAKKDIGLIGQFGVGFYSAFMVAEKVDVFTRKAGEPHGWHWSSDGRGAFTVGPAEGEVKRGTRVLLHLREGETEFLEEYRLSEIVRKYSDHIALPIKFGSGEEIKTLNRASALWTRSKSEISADEYKEFYHHVGHAFDEPWLTIHWRAEGKLEYTSLLFVPQTKPFDLFDPKRAHRVKLYVRRVFITEGVEGLVPSYLRFLRGIVNSEDLPLNVSREMLQNNPLVTKIRGGLVRRVLGDFAKKAEENAEDYATFWENYGTVLKEGLYEDFEHRETLFKIARFHSTHGPGLVSLEDYIGRMKEGQDDIFLIQGDDREQLAKSPQLEGFKARGVEVLLLTDPVDEFWVSAVGTFKDKKFVSVTRGGIDLTKIQATPDPAEAEKPKAPEGKLATLIALFKSTLGDAVKDVRASQRLTDSAVCLIADEGDMDIHLERILRQHKHMTMNAKRILELNPGHPLICRLAEGADTPGTAASMPDLAWLLLDQARIVEGEHVEDPVAFARRFAALMERGLAA